MILDVLTAVFLLVGAALCLLGALGVVRLPDLPARLQAATKPQTLGLLCILAAAALRLDVAGALALALVGVFQVLTAPVIAQLLGRTAYRTGTARDEVLVVDERE
ncbi:monovalent cation/H(+) antiporter subunit G [Pseudonocardia sp.]|uniref:monovalent cation/H(+) antiporter subunit G n=1 Tax=Pseudonocardia sp. TaxID=60912 RepID=UPI003D0BE14E